MTQPTQQAEQTDSPRTAVDLLGGEMMFESAQPVATRYDWVSVIRQRFHAAAIGHLAKNIGLDVGDVELLLGYNDMHGGTLERMLRLGGPLDLHVSEQLARIALVVARAEAVFQSRSGAMAWLKTPNQVVKYEPATTPISCLDAPLMLLDTCAGASIVNEMLNDIEAACEYGEPLPSLPAMEG